MGAGFDASRRRLLQASAAASVGLVLPLRLGAATAGSADFEPNAFVRVQPDDTVVLTVHRSEMGQGIRTALAMVLCDELDADWPRVQVRRAEGDEKRYGDQNTVGDFSFIESWVPLRLAAASARAMLVQAAARRLGLKPEQLRTENGRVIVAGSQPERALRYGELAAAAALETPPDPPTPKTPDQYRLVGKPMGSVDLRDQTTGRMAYGIDVVRPGMRYAVVERAPLPAVRLAEFDAEAARHVPGVQAVFELPARFAEEGATYAGVAVVAEDSWACLKARRLLKPQWDTSALPAGMPLDSATIRAHMEAAIARPGAVVRSGGDVDAARQRAAQQLKRRYYTPFLCHAPMEPPNCTADVRPDRCEVWAPTQDPAAARERVAAELGLPLQQVRVNVTPIGGGFGRKSMHDFVLEAVRISREAKAPVKLFWTREDDLRHGYFRTPCLQELEGGLDAHGELLFWRHHTVQSSQRPTSVDGPVTQLSTGEVFGNVARLPYAIPHVRFEGTHVDTPLKRSWMRGVQDAFHAFAGNCFLDELAALKGCDPVAWRLALLGAPRRMQFARTTAETDFWIDTGRYAEVIRRAAELGGWGQALPAGQGRGFASQVQGPTYVAMTAEVEPSPQGFRVTRIACAVDCGLVVNPDSARAQVEGAVLYGLSSCLFGEITLAGGAVQQSNFHDYPVARIGDAPRIDVAFVQGSQRPVGLGEPCVPLVAPAVANALAAAGLGRLYEWPLRLPARAGGHS